MKDAVLPPNVKQDIPEIALSRIAKERKRNHSRLPSAERRLSFLLRPQKNKSL
jgi:hypothetical protein